MINFLSRLRRQIFLAFCNTFSANGSIPNLIFNIDDGSRDYFIPLKGMPKEMSRKLPLLIPLFLITLAESLFFLKMLETTLLVHGINLFFCIFFPFAVKHDPSVYQGFSLVSVLRILNLGMPVFWTLTLYWLPFIYGAAILASYCVLKSEEKEKLSERVKRAFVSVKLHPKRYLFFTTAGVFMGLMLSNLEFAVLKSESLIPSLDVYNLLLLAIVMFLFIGFGEELIFRFILQTRLQREYGRYQTLFIASFVFMLMHSGYSSLTYLVFVFFIGLVLGYAFMKTRSLFFITIIHGSINFFLFSLIPNGYLTLF
ncbi:MAG: type II CAAX endopeptidase family protein [Methanomassiliicoccales archaeon]